VKPGPAPGDATNASAPFSWPVWGIFAVRRTAGGRFGAGTGTPGGHPPVAPGRVAGGFPTPPDTHGCRIS